MDVPLIDLIKEGIEQKKYPLIVAEGDWQKKMEQINSSDYLSHCYFYLENIQGTLFTYGFSFGGSDQHIMDAISNNHNLQRLCIGVYEGADNKRANLEMVGRVTDMIQKRTKLNGTKSYLANKQANIMKTENEDENQDEAQGEFVPDTPQDQPSPSPFHELEVRYFKTNEVPVWRE